MKRLITDELIKWKNSTNKKPLIIKGARQVGKSYSVKEFGKTHFDQFLRIDFLADKKAHALFTDEDSLMPKDILERLDFNYGEKIIPGSCLIFFDEIQECPNALKSLKFFAEQMPELHIIGAGSYLGIMVNQESYPVGKVDFLEMYPMTYAEFLESNDERLFLKYKDISISDLGNLEPIVTIVHERLLEKWHLYQALGGMPEVIREFNRIDNLFEATQEARRIQKNLIQGYLADFSKHAGTVNGTHILNVFENASAQLAKAFDENVKKFQFQGVIPNRRGFESIRGPLTWLEKSHLLLKNFIIKRPEHPLKASVNDNQFKLYYFDVGLLNAMLEVPMDVIINSKNGSYKGFIAENFVIQELTTATKSASIYSWQESRAEIEFILVRGAQIIPIEVKSSEKSARAKSLDSYIQRFSPELAIKLSPKNIGFDQSNKILSVPIYLAAKLI